MNYYPFHIGDYITHTAHLSPLEDIAYRRLLDLYYQTEAALTGDVQRLSRLIRMREHEQEVAHVLDEFFICRDERWFHARCDAELLRMTDKQAKARASAGPKRQECRSAWRRTSKDRRRGEQGGRGS